MSRMLNKIENKILVILLLFSISIGLWGNFRQLWMESNGLEPNQISNILGFGTLLCVGCILIFSKYKCNNPDTSILNTLHYFLHISIIKAIHTAVTIKTSAVILSTIP